MNSKAKLPPWSRTIRPREYEVYAYDNGTLISKSPAFWRGRMRLRQMAVDMFRRYFGGREPNLSFAIKGYGEAHDLDKGFFVEIVQKSGKWAVQKYQPPVELKAAA